jgi:hypothetical protein
MVLWCFTVGVAGIVLGVAMFAGGMWVACGWADRMSEEDGS